MADSSSEEQAKSLKVGSFYEVDHNKLPLESPELLYAIWIVMVNDDSPHWLLLSFPTVHSLKTYFSREGRDKSPELPAFDGKYVMSSDTAAKVLFGRITPQEMAERGHYSSLWSQLYWFQMREQQGGVAFSPDVCNREVVNHYDSQSVFVRGESSTRKMETTEMLVPSEGTSCPPRLLRFGQFPPRFLPDKLPKLPLVFELLPNLPSPEWLKNYVKFGHMPPVKLLKRMPLPLRISTLGTRHVPTLHLAPRPMLGPIPPLGPQNVPALQPAPIPVLGPQNISALQAAPMPPLGPQNISALQPAPRPMLGPPQVPALQPAPIPVLGSQNVPALQPAPIPPLGPQNVPALQPTPIPVLGPQNISALQPAPIPRLGPQNVPALQPAPMPVLGPQNIPALQPAPVPVLGPLAALAPAPMPQVAPLAPAGSSAALSPPALPDKQVSRAQRWVADNLTCYHCDRPQVFTLRSRLESHRGDAHYNLKKGRCPRCKMQYRPKGKMHCRIETHVCRPFV